MATDPLRDTARIECIIRLCAFEGDALYEILWDLWTRFPRLRERRDEVIAAVRQQVEPLVRSGVVVLWWSTWDPHVLVEPVKLSELASVLASAQSWEPGQQFVSVVLSESERKRNASFADCLEWRAESTQS